MRTSFTRITIFCLLLTLAAMPLFAQGGNQGSMEGTVTDESGAVVPAVALIATKTATGATYNVTTTEGGLFRFAILPVGTYQIAASKQGFTEFVQKNVEVGVGAKVNLKLILKAAGNVQTIVVDEETPVVETTRTQVSSSVNERAISNLPSNGRNFIDFVLLTPGVNRDVRGGDLSFAGQRGTLNSLTVDGADNNNTFFGQTLGRTGSGSAPYQFSQDAVQEFQVNTNGYSAEFGRAGGAVINVVTKSGTNDFHGTAFEFFRDRGLNANDPIYSLQRAAAIAGGTTLPIRPGYHFNQFGGNIGGPIVTNRAFFFVDYDGQRNKIGNSILLTLPAPTNAFEATAVNYLSARSTNYDRTFNQNVYLAKLDYTLTATNQLSGRYNVQRFTGQGLENSGTASAFEHTGTSLVNTDTVEAQETATLTPNLINIVRFSYQRDNEPGQANSTNPEAMISNYGPPLLSIGRNSLSPRETTIHRQQYADTVSWVHGHHNLRVGGDLVRDRILNHLPTNFSGSYTFDSLYAFGRSLQGLPVNDGENSFVQAYTGVGTTGAITHPNLMQYAGFAQDDWKVHQNLTLNLGLRYDLETVRQPTIQNAYLLAFGINTKKIPIDTNNFAPRIGIAWQPSSNRQFVVRGGYGIFYGNTPSMMYAAAQSNNGINIKTFIVNAGVKPSNLPPQLQGRVPLPASYPNVPCDLSGSSAGCPSLYGTEVVPPDIVAFQSRYVQPYVQQYNLGIEYELTRGLSLSVGYLGVHGLHLQRTRDFSVSPLEVLRAVAIQGTGRFVYYNQLYGHQTFQGYGRIFEYESNANSHYNGLAAQVNKRFSHNFQISAAYTWSHVIDDNPDATVVVSGTDDSKLVYDPNRPYLDRGTGSNDVRNRLVMNGVWQLAYANGLRNTLLKTLAEGWEIAGIFTAQSGQPYTALVSVDLNYDGNSSNERAPGFGRNTFNLPSIVSLDPRLTRNVRITERARMQFIVEAFNVLNRANITGVRNILYRPTFVSFVGYQLAPQTVGTAGINAFGMPAAASPGGAGNVGRVLQFAAKISF